MRQIVITLDVPDDWPWLTTTADLVVQDQDLDGEVVFASHVGYRGDTPLYEAEVGS